MQRRACLQALATSGWVALESANAAQQNQLRIGLTPVILADQAAFLSRWGRYLSERTGCDVSFIARESYQPILDQLFSAQIDAAWICGYPYVRHESQLAMLCVPLYMGRPSYQAYLIRARKGTQQIAGWADLKGKVLAYSDPLSNSGWLVAQVEMAKVGIDQRELTKTFFAHGHRNVAEAVASQLANAGSIDGYVWETMMQQKMAAAARTEVIWKSEPFGFPPLVTLRGSRHPFIAPLQKALMSMADDAAGKDLLSALNLSGFTTGQAQFFDSIRQQARLVAGSGVVS